MIDLSAGKERFSKPFGGQTRREDELERTELQLAKSAGDEDLLHLRTFSLSSPLCVKMTVSSSSRSRIHPNKPASDGKKPH